VINIKNLLLKEESLSLSFKKKLFICLLLELEFQSYKKFDFRNKHTNTQRSILSTNHFYDWNFSFI